MKKVWLLMLLVVGLVGCGTSDQNSGSNSEQIKTTESSQVNDFKVTLHLEENLEMYATITYSGEEAEVEINHGGSIFFFNIHQQDGSFEYESVMTEQLLTTNLVANEPYRVDFNQVKKLELNKGKYEFQAIADFSVSSNDGTVTPLKIPVSIVREIN